MLGAGTVDAPTWIVLASRRRIPKGILAPGLVRRGSAPSLTLLFFQRAGNVHKLLESVGLVVDGDTVVDFQHLDNARKLGDDFVLDLHLCRTA